MLKPSQLFLARVKNGWSYQYKVWKTAIDWTIWVYIIIPLIAIGGYNYHLLLLGELLWIKGFPIEYTWLLPFYLSWRGTIRLFLENGDLLFLRQNQRWLKDLMRLGILYSLLKNTLFLSFLFLIFYPIWSVYGEMTLITAIMFFVFSGLFTFTIQLEKQLVTLRIKGWRQLLFLCGLFIVNFGLFLLYLMSNILIQPVFILVFTGVLLYLIKQRLKLTWSFYEDCLREEEQRLKLAVFLLGLTGHIEKKPLFRRTRPLLLFRNSMNIFQQRTRKNIATELFLKFFLRSNLRLLFLLQLFLAFSVVLFVAPSWLKWLLLVVCSLCIIHFVQGSWKGMERHPFFKLYLAKDMDNAIKGMKKAVAIVAIPICFLFTFIVGMTTMNLLMTFTAAVATSLLVYSYVMKQFWL